MPTLLPITFSHAYTKLSFPQLLLEQTAARIYRGERIPRKRALSVVLCSDAVIRRLNAKFRKIDRATDVLSFPFDDPGLLGEIYISLPRCRVQARRYGLHYDQEILRMFVHGLIHLLDHDHHTPAERARMEAVEGKYWRLDSVTPALGDSHPRSG